MPKSVVSHNDLLAVELHPTAPLEVTDGYPRAFDAVLYRDEVIECGVWEVTPGVFLGENTGFGEYMYVLHGEGTVTSADGATLELRPGVSFVARPGWRGSWRVRETIRKIYVIWKMPTRQSPFLPVVEQRGAEPSAN
jgi:uncharacterized protein